MTIHSQAFIRALESLLAVAFLCSCLPDPQPYDPCADEESQYYSVPPRGCNGHRLETLHVHQGQSGVTSVSDGPLSMPPNAHYMNAKSQIALDDAFVYWSSIDGSILRTAKSDAKTDVLRSASPTITSTNGVDPLLFILGLDSAGKTLFFTEVLSEVDTSRISSSVTGVQLKTGEVRTLASFSDIAMGRALVHDGVLYFLSATGGPLYSVPLDWSKTVGSNDLTAVPSDPMFDFAILDNRIYYLTTNTATLEMVDLRDGTRKKILTRATAEAFDSAVAASNGGIYYFECDRDLEFTCAWMQVTEDGAVRTAASGLASWTPTMAADDRATYAVAYRVDAVSLRAKLYSWPSTDKQPLETLAAPFEQAQAMALDDDYVYLTNYSWDNGTFNDEGSSTIPTAQLMRIRR